MVPTGPGWNSTRVICRDCSKKQEVIKTESNKNNNMSLALFIKKKKK